MPAISARVIPPATMARPNSLGASGVIRRSTMLPWILAITRLDEVCEKALWIIAIMIRPGARNSRNGTPPISRSTRPSANEKMVSISSAVTIGANTVCVGTLRKRKTSLR